MRIFTDVVDMIKNDSRINHTHFLLFEMLLNCSSPLTKSPADTKDRQSVRKCIGAISPSTDFMIGQLIPQPSVSPQAAKRGAAGMFAAVCL